MALDLGTLVGYLEIDATKAKSGVAEGEAAIDRFEKTGKAKAKTAGDKVGGALGKGVTDGIKGEESRIKSAGEDAGESFGDGVKSKIAALGLGAAVTAGLMEGLNLGAAGDKLVASLGAQHKRGEKLTRIATDIYKGAWGESVDEVNLALGSVVTSMSGMRKATEKELTSATTKALDFAAAFDVDVARSVQVAGTLMSSGLAKNATEAFDLLTRGSQKVPTQLRGDLQDAAEEYGQFFAGLGYDGEQAFAMLVEGSEKGIYGIDKVGDAVKEFTIRGTDMSKATKDAYGAIGITREEIGGLTNDLLAGGDTAQAATRRIVDGLLSIEDPGTRANAAIALFGTPLEDLNVKEIPDFLRNMRGASGRMDDFRGASKKMGDQLNDNAKTSLTGFTRKMKMGLVGYLESDVIPFIEDEVVPAFKGIGDALDDLPGWAVKGTVGGVLGLLLAGKVANIGANTFSGLSKLVPGKGGGLGGALGKAGPVPVFVTNPGFGAGGVPGGSKPVPPVVTGTPTKTGKLARGLTKGLKAVPFVGTTIVAGEIIGDDADKFVGDGGGALGLGGGIKDMAARANGVEKFADAWGKVETMADRAHPKINTARQQVKLFGDAVSGLPPAKTVKVKVDGVAQARALLEGLGRDLDWVARPREARITIAQRYAAAGHQALGGPQERAGGGPVIAGMPYLVGEREPELFVPNTSGRILNQRQMATEGITAGGDPGRIAPLMQGVTIQLRDMADVERYTTKQARVRSGGGVVFR